MCFQSSSQFVKGIVVVLWTIIQTSFHIILVLGEYYVCQFKPSHYLLVIFYITYFYNYDKCGTISVSEENFFSVKNERNLSRLIDLKTEATDDEDDIYKIIQTLIETAILPRESKSYFRTQIYLFIYIILDACWLLSTFLLFAGICFKVKKYLSIIFYVPWLVITGILIVLDVVSAVHFGLDMLYIYNYTSWLRFIGVSNNQDYAKFNRYRSSSYVPHISSIIMALFWSRFFIFWIINIINIFTITNSFILVYRDGIVQKPARRLVDQTLNSTESRIRNWQMFYGTVETNSTRSSGSRRSVDQDYNSNSRRRKHSEDYVRKVAGNSTTRYSLDSNNSPQYLKYQDVTEGINVDQMYRRDSEDYEKNQRPWSYLTFNERPPSILLEGGQSSSTKTGPSSSNENGIGSTLL